MLMILEISFTIAAWRNGWRCRALLPALSVVLAGMILGSQPASVPPRELLLLLDLACVGALYVMRHVRPTAIDQPAQSVAPMEPIRQPVESV